MPEQTTKGNNPCLTRWDNWNVSWGFKSRHSGGANFLFGDGSVHNIKYGLDPQTFNALGNMDDGTNLHADPDSIN